MNDLPYVYTRVFSLQLESEYNKIDGIQTVSVVLIK